MDTFSTLVQFIATIKTFRLVSFLITKLQNQKCILYLYCCRQSNQHSLSNICWCNIATVVILFSGPTNIQQPPHHVGLKNNDNARNKEQITVTYKIFQQKTDKKVQMKLLSKIAFCQPQLDRVGW